MFNPAAESLMDTVRKLNQLAQRSRSGEPQAEDYLRAISSDPATAWFTDLLREKNQELESEKQRLALLSDAVRAWAQERTSSGPAHAADVQLITVLRDLEII